MNPTTVEAGDVVAIRGDLWTRNDGRSAWRDDQLIDGKYVKCPVKGGIKTYAVKKVYYPGEYCARANLINGGNILVELLEVMYKGTHNETIIE